MKPLYINKMRQLQPMFFFGVFFIYVLLASPSPCPEADWNSKLKTKIQLLKNWSVCSWCSSWKKCWNLSWKGGTLRAQYPQNNPAPLNKVDWNPWVSKIFTTKRRLKRNYRKFKKDQLLKNWSVSNWCSFLKKCKNLSWKGYLRKGYLWKGYLWSPVPSKEGK